MKKILLLTILCVFSWQVYAQTEDITTTIAKAEFQEKQVIPPSPIAAELGKYGNVPVSLFTGTPNISIPLYELKGTLLSLPISLSYNNSGFKPEDLATWTGSGWSLIAGGVITRSVAGNPDVESNYFSAVNPLFTAPPFSYYPSRIIPYYDQMNNRQQLLVESQPDTYFYNFAGYSGKFYLKPDQSVLKKKKDMLKITSGILSPGGSNFSIVDEHGNTYSFTDIETTESQPNDEGGAPIATYNYPSSWFLTKIQTADLTEEIDFDYNTTTGVQTMYPNNSHNESRSYKFETNPDLICSPVISFNGYTSVAPTSYIKRKFLKKITLIKNGQNVAYIDLVSSLGNRLDSPDFSEDRRLDSVNVYSTVNSTTKPIKKYALSYSYFTNPSNPTTKYRLRLDALQELSVSAGTTSKPPYQFTYDTSTPIPERFTKGIDHWGFYNRSDNNTTLIPAVNVPGYAGATVNAGLNANREADLFGSSCTTLTKMQYPAGGYTTFEYELNSAEDATGALKGVGGVRIKTIVDYPYSGQQATSKSYTYALDDGSPSGAAQFPVYLKTTFTTTYTTPCIGGGCTACQVDVLVRWFTTCTVSTNSVFG